MNSYPHPATPNRSPILLGCVGAVVMSMLSCCALAGLAVVPALGSSMPPLGSSMPPPPVPNPTRPDVTIIVAEPYLNRALTDSLPGTVQGKTTLDVQPGNRLVVTAMFDLALTEVQVVTTLHLAAEAGQIQIVVESIEAGGHDILRLLGTDSDALSQAMSAAIQEQVEAGLGKGAQVMGIVTNEERITVTARWASQGK